MPITALEVGLVTPADGSYGDDWIDLVALHLSVQPDAAAGGLGAVRAWRATACRWACRSSGRRGRTQSVLRAARAVERAHADAAGTRMRRKWLLTSSILGTLRSILE